MEKTTVGEHEFELVDSVPFGYIIRNIGKNMIDGYLPLCRLSDRQPFPGGRSIETNTLKAIKVDGAQTILAAAGCGPNTVKEVEAYIEKHSTTKYRDWETDRKSTRLNSSHSAKSRMPSSA